MTLLLVLIYAAFISLGLPDSILGSAWPAMQPDLGAPLSLAGALSLVVSVCTVVSSAVSVRVIARFGVGRVTLVSVAMTALALIGYAAAPGFWALCLLALPLGLGAGSVDAALNNFVATNYEARHMSWLHCFWGVGATAGPLIMSFWIARSAGWRGGYLSIGCIQLALTLVLLFSLRLWRSGEGGNGPSEKPLVLSFRQMAALPCAGAAFLTFFCYCALEQAVGLWGASYLTGARGFSAAEAATCMSLYYFGITAGRLVTGFFAGKFSDARLIRIGELVIFFGLALLVLPDSAYIPPTALLLIGLGCAPVFPSMLHRTPELFGTASSQAMTGAQMSCAYMGVTLMPPIFGLAAQRVSVSLLPLYCAALFGGMLLCTEHIRRRGSRKS
ncbi:MAG: MFS transporter [Oscillospiraceae bacterium]